MTRSRSRWSWFGVGVVSVFLFVFYAQAAIDWELEGVADEERVVNILQITPGDPENPEATIDDWVPCWGTNPWSRDGQWIVYQSKIGTGSTNEICIINSDGTGYQRLTNNDVCDTHGNFTPDGKKIVFQREVDGDAEIWIMDKDGSNQTSLTQARGGPVVEGTCENKPLVSPNGKKIAFRTCDEDIWVMDIDGSNPVKVSGELANCSKHSWSSDSAWILFNSKVSYDVNGGKSRIHKVRPGGADLTMLSENVDSTSCENWAEFSPNRKSISYHRRYRDNDLGLDISQIWIMDANGGNKRLLLSFPSPEGEEDDERLCGPHSWHPSSNYIVFKKWEPTWTINSLYMLDVGTGETFKLTQDYADGRAWWSPKGAQILFKEYRWSNLVRDGGKYGYDLLILNLDNSFKHGGGDSSSSGCFIDSLR